MGYTEKICTELMSKQLRNVQGEQEMDVEVQEQVWQQAERGSGSVAPGPDRACADRSHGNKNTFRNVACRTEPVGT